MAGGRFALVLCLSGAATPPSRADDTPPPAADGVKGARRAEVGGADPGLLNIDRWAVVVGISKYNNKDWNLKYAARDAAELAALLETPAGGGFAKDHVLKLTNEQATTAAVSRALRSFLKK